ncbi:MAG: ERF family protein, partial [Cytophagales bacterium]|nr:ERF family protein [Cytophagales bacterium]
MSETKAVYKAISAVQAELATIGIGKGQRNDYDKYNFRGIDDVYNVLAGILAKNELCILPRVMGRECVERTSNKGTPLFHVTLEVEYDFVSAKDGSQHILKAFGEALDRSDKATPKAMSAAYKYLCFEAF